jgi:hypothetical protein
MVTNGTFSLYSILMFSLLLMSGLWLAIATMNGGVCEFKGMVNLVNNVFSVFIMVLMSLIRKDLLHDYG